MRVPPRPTPAARAAQADSEVVTLDRDLVRLNTVNPPGSTAAVAEYLRARLAPLGFEVDVIQTPAPGKAHLIARLRSANPTGKPVLLSAHADTVGVEPELWSVDPFAGAISGRLPLRARLLRRQGRHRGLRRRGHAARARTGCR